MSGLNHSFTFLRSALRPQIMQRANVSHHPAKHVVSSGEQVFAMVTFFAAILGPSGWVLANLENYKKRE